MLDFGVDIWGKVCKVLCLVEDMRLVILGVYGKDVN